MRARVLLDATSVPAETLVAAKAPPSFWTKLPPAPRPHDAEAWSYGSFFALSSFWRMPVAVPYGMTRSVDPVPVFHLTISLRHARRPDDRDCARVLEAFGMSGAMEMPTKPTANARQFVKPAV